MSIPGIESVSVDGSFALQKLESSSLKHLYLDYIPSIPREGIGLADNRLSLGVFPRLKELHLVYAFANEKVTCSFRLMNYMHGSILIHIQSLLSIYTLPNVNGIDGKLEECHLLILQFTPEVNYTHLVLRGW